MRFHSRQIAILVSILCVGCLHAAEVAPHQRIGAWLTVDATGHVLALEWERPEAPILRASLEPAIRALTFDRPSVGTGTRRSRLSGWLRLEADGDAYLPRLEELDLGPKVSRLRPPRFPSQAILAQQGGRVLAVFEVDREGRAKEIRVQHVGRGGMFEAAVRDALKQWRFEPETRDGQAIASTMCVPFRFTVDIRAARGAASAEENALQCPALPDRLLLQTQDRAYSDIEITASRKRR